MKTIILLSGKKESGKSTAANIFTKQGFIEQSFAAELKNQLFVFTKYVLGSPDITYDHFQKQELKNIPITIPNVDKEITPRYIMQVYGTEVMRVLFNDEYWVATVINKIKRSNTNLFCISDNRFPNEIEGMKQAFSSDKVVSVRIIRGEDVGDQHPSETALDSYTGWDYVIDNNGSLDEYITNLYEVSKLIINGEKI